MTYLYETIAPSRIYVKQCSHCGKNYMGKTTKQNIKSYRGSGQYWTDHLKLHKAKSIHVWNSDWFYDKSIVDYALGLSKEHNIVESKDWFNVKPENGLDGGYKLSETQENSRKANYAKAMNARKGVKLGHGQAIAQGRLEKTMSTLEDSKIEQLKELIDQNLSMHKIRQLTKLTKAVILHLYPNTFTKEYSSRAISIQQKKRVEQNGPSFYGKKHTEATKYKMRQVKQSKKVMQNGRSE